MSDYEDYESTLAATDCDGSELETRPFKRKCVSVGGKAPRTGKSGMFQTGCY